MCATPFTTFLNSRFFRAFCCFLTAKERLRIYPAPDENEPRCRRLDRTCLTEAARSDTRSTRRKRTGSLRPNVPRTVAKTLPATRRQPTSKSIKRPRGLSMRLVHTGRKRVRRRVGARGRHRLLGGGLRLRLVRVHRLRCHGRRGRSAVTGAPSTEGKIGIDRLPGRRYRHRSSWGSAPARTRVRGNDHYKDANG